MELYLNYGFAGALTIVGLCFTLRFSETPSHEAAVVGILSTQPEVGSHEGRCKG
jgi:hypothetical protein